MIKVGDIFQFSSFNSTPIPEFTDDQQVRFYIGDVTYEITVNKDGDGPYLEVRKDSFGKGLIIQPNVSNSVKIR